MRCSHLSVILVMLALLAAACGGETSEAPTGTETGPPAVTTPVPATDEPADAAASPTAGAQAVATVMVASSSLGEIVVDGDGRTLYLFLNDDQGAPSCYDDCAVNWPPLVGPADAGDGVDGSLLGVVERDDGTAQVTYNGWPLYHFAGDDQAGDTNGQGLGEVWFAVDPAGEPVR